MIERGSGKVVNICSVMSELARETIAPYTAAKGGRFANQIRIGRREQEESGRSQAKKPNDDAEDKIDSPHTILL